MLKVNLNDDQMDEQKNGNEKSTQSGDEIKNNRDGLDFKEFADDLDDDLGTAEEDLIISEDTEIIVEESSEEDKTELLEVTDTRAEESSEIQISGAGDLEDKLTEADNDETVLINPEEEASGKTEDEELIKMKEKLAAMAAEEEAALRRASAPAEPEPASEYDSSGEEPETEVFEDSEDGDYYEDSFNQSSGKKKWLIIGGLLLIVIAALFYFLNPFAGGEKKEVVEKPKETPEMAMARQKRNQEIALIQQIQSGLTNQVLPVKELFTQIPKDMKLSMILIYGNEITVETFSGSRTPLAVLRKNLKNAGLFDNYKTERVISLRPDKDVLATLSAVPSGKSVAADSNAVFTAPSNVDLELQNLAGAAGVTVKKIADLSDFRAAGNLKKARISFAVSGNEKNIVSFLEKLSTSGMTVGIDKLSVASVSKNNVKKRKMQGRLDLFVYAPGF